MATIFLLTGLAFGLFAVGALFLAWAARSGQWDDLDTPAQRMLGEDPPLGRSVNPPQSEPALRTSAGNDQE